MTAVYNENDPAAAAWLRELIANNLIAPGDVDERSIKDVRAEDYRRYTQVHCFAGIGLWSAGLRRAGWEDDRPIGTGSCPCQPFSAAGKSLGFDDPRHLWPDWLRLIDAAREAGQSWASTILGEQVASAGVWLDLVQSHMEDRHYAFAATDLPAAGFAQGAHIRQRFYWVADLHDTERWADLAGRDFGDWPQTGRIEGYGEHGAGGEDGVMADANDQGEGGRRVSGRGEGPGEGSGIALERPAGLREAGGMANDDLDGRDRLAATRLHGRRSGAGGDQPAEGDPDGSRRDDADGRREDGGLDDAVAADGWEGAAFRAGGSPAGLSDEDDGMADLTAGGRGKERPHPGGSAGRDCEEGVAPGHGVSSPDDGLGDDGGAGSPLGSWGPDSRGAIRVQGPALGAAGSLLGCDWLLCHDSRIRPVEAGTFPLAASHPARVGLLRGYGNGLDLKTATNFIAAYMEAVEIRDTMGDLT